MRYPVGVEGIHSGDDSFSGWRRVVAALAGGKHDEGLSGRVLSDGRNAAKKKAAILLLLFATQNISTFIYRI